MTTPRFADDHEPNVIVAVEMPASMRDSIRQCATELGWTVQHWLTEALKVAIEIEADIKADREREAAKKKTKTKENP